MRIVVIGATSAIAEHCCRLWVERQPCDLVLVARDKAKAGRVTADLAVRSPFGLIAVRGTRFFAGPSNGVFSVFVERGAVQVVGVNTWVIVTGGSGTDIAQPGGEPTHPHPWGAARIANAIASVS